MNKIPMIIAMLLWGIGLSSCAFFPSKHTSRDANCGTLDICHHGHIHHNTKQHYDRHSWLINHTTEDSSS